MTRATDVSMSSGSSQARAAREADGRCWRAQLCLRLWLQDRGRRDGKVCRSRTSCTALEVASKTSASRCPSSAR